MVRNLKPDPDMRTADKPLTPRQQAFVDAYLGSAKFNATAAARAAGYSSRTPAGLRNIAHETLTKPYIQKIISDRLSASALSAQDSMKEMAAIASTGMAAFIQVGPTGRVKVDMAKAAAAGALNQIKEFRSFGKGKFVIKLHDRVRALEIMMKHHGLLAEKVEIHNPLSPSKATEDELRMLCEKHGLPLPPGLCRKP